MGVTKTEIFTVQQNSLATSLKALAHPARIAILQYIIKQNACICNDLVEELGLAKELLSTTKLSVSEIAYRLGFEYPQSFSKVFKNKMNQTPLVFRQSFN
ncbi:helix-turn-helix domain-containing protein [Sphingobacterium sp. SYP-B4668]|uniref:helix-turn-helix domain-containing protein n=1 Tax=Sphingobacterium sp. SYP-B4668 TaxID=2996035 RepID=UPI0022DCF3B0|nr:helix-turn-helix domain-containing protein [Sphingobacterium sp. SYP-B4668]